MREAPARRQSRLGKTFTTTANNRRMKKILLPLLLALAGCQPPATPGNTDLCTYLPLHSEAARLDGDNTPRFQAADRRIDQNTADGDDSKRKYCGQSWRSAADDEAMKTAIAATLGQDWRYRDTLPADDLTITLWETRSRFWPKKYYALTTAPAQDGALRLMRSTYIENSVRDLNGPVVFGIIISPFAIVLAIIVPLVWRKRRRARQQR